MKIAENAQRRNEMFSLIKIFAIAAMWFKKATSLPKS